MKFFFLSIFSFTGAIRRCDRICIPGRQHHPVRHVQLLPQAAFLQQLPVPEPRCRVRLPRHQLSALPSLFHRRHLWLETRSLLRLQHQQIHIVQNDSRSLDMRKISRLPVLPLEVQVTYLSSHFPVTCCFEEFLHY